MAFEGILQPDRSKTYRKYKSKASRVFVSIKSNYISLRVNYVNRIHVPHNTSTAIKAYGEHKESEMTNKKMCIVRQHGQCCGILIIRVWRATY
jgi:hypothetical protein